MVRNTVFYQSSLVIVLLWIFVSNGYAWAIWAIGVGGDAGRGSRIYNCIIGFISHTVHSLCLGNQPQEQQHLCKHLIRSANTCSSLPITEQCKISACIAMLLSYRFVIHSFSFSFFVLKHYEQQVLLAPCH